MTLEQLVPTLEICQQLREAGFPQDTAFSWYPADSPEDAETVEKDLGKEFIKHDAFVFMTGKCNDAICAAPTAEEILRVLPVRIGLGEKEACLESFASTMNDFYFYVGWQAYHIPSEKEDPWYGADKLSEAAAQAYLWWKKEVAG